MELKLKVDIEALETKLKTLTNSRERSTVLTKLDEVRLWLREHFEKLPADKTIEPLPDHLGVEQN